MDAKQHKTESEKYVNAQKEYRVAMEQADRAVHSEDSKVKYDPKTGSLTEEK